MKRSLYKIILVLMVLSLTLPGFTSSVSVVQAAGEYTFTILHTNDFHGNLEPTSSVPGAARDAQFVVDKRAALGAENVLLLDAGDIMQGNLLSNIQKGEPTIAYYRQIGYNAATFGNHEFDWGLTTLTARVNQAKAAKTTDPVLGNQTPFPFLSANIVKKDAGAADCSASSGWTPADFATPYVILNVGSAGSPVKVAVTAVTTMEVPYITFAGNTSGICFRDPAEAITRIYDDLRASANVVVVLSHLGLTDGGYGYGLNVYGDTTLASRLVTNNTPVDLIIGGHSHTNMTAVSEVTYTGGKTYVVQANTAGKNIGEAAITVDGSKKFTGLVWTNNTLDMALTPYDPTLKLIDSYKTTDYTDLVNTEIGYSSVDLKRNYYGNGMMGHFVNDAVYGYFNEDQETTNDVDLVFNNPGGLRVDLCAAATCVDGVYPAGTDPQVLTYGRMFSVLPFGNQTVVGTMKGIALLDLLNQSASLYKGAIQPSGIKYKYYTYGTFKTDSAGKTTYSGWSWGAFDAQVYNHVKKVWEPLDLTKDYKVATNEFLAPAGPDGFYAFKQMTGVKYYGDMLDTVNAYVSKKYTKTSPYKGPAGDGVVDARAEQVGTYVFDPATSPIIPVTILHNNDSHGRLLPVYDPKTDKTSPGFDQLATLIKTERAMNPGRTILVSAGDAIQGDSMMYFFKAAGLGVAADGKTLPAELKINPMIKAMRVVGYDAMTLGNHEFNFGKDVFGTLAKASSTDAADKSLAGTPFAVLQANLKDDGTYGIAKVPVQKSVEKTVLGTSDTDLIKIGIVGIGNHRIPQYELPSNIPGLTFTDPIETAKAEVPGLRADNDIVIALTHIGFTTDPKSVEVDTKVDTNLAAEVPGLDAIIGGHSHTDPTKGQAPYGYLPAFVEGNDGKPVPIAQAYRYNNYLGEIFLGLQKDNTGKYQVITHAGTAKKVDSALAEDPDVLAAIKPYADLLKAYNGTVIGTAIRPIDTQDAYTEETNGANLQADAAVWKLTKELPADKRPAFHLSGAMTNATIASGASALTPYTLTVKDMFTAMPYENSLLVIKMNGPQIKTVLERAYRNYYYYKYVEGQGGYSYYTTCMIDINSLGNQITYNDTYPQLPSGNNVASLTIGGKPVDFKDAKTFYNVSTVNYLAAGSCNNNDDGKTLWPLSQTVADTQFYVRDAVTEYIQYLSSQNKVIDAQVEGRLRFNILDRIYFLPVIHR